MPISIELTVGDRVVATDLVTVVVVSNTLVIGIDGTWSDKWLSKKVNGVRINERDTQDGTRWNSHVRNLVADSGRFAMTIYKSGPALDGSDSDDIFRAVRDEANKMIEAAGGGTKVALVGWSRGAMIALWAANELSGLVAQIGGMHRTVEFVGLYDPVDMASEIPENAAKIHADIRRVTIVGPTADRQTEDAFNVDYDVMDGGLINPHFVRMARGGRITAADGAATAVQRLFYNASHGAIGGTPGYNRRHGDGGRYDYPLDRRDSIRADKDIRDGMRAAGLPFVPVRDDTWYGFPAERPPEDHRE